jgi:hypothetical protein
MPKINLPAVVAAFLLFTTPTSSQAAPKATSKATSLSDMKWKQGPPSGRDYFPIGVWLQSPENAAKYQAAGINLYVGLWEGPTEAQLAALKAAQMSVICEQNAVGLAHKNDPTIVGWMHVDEPDNAQSVTDPATGKQSYGPCIPPAKIIAEYARMAAADPTRPVLLNLGEGVANDDWIGRGAGATLADYPKYIKGSDIVSFDVYPIAGLNKPDGENYLWYVPKGVTRLVGWTAGQKPVWNYIECTHIGSDKKPTPRQVRSEVWMALIHGSHGLLYFAHEFQPKFNEHALLDDAPMLAEVTQINRQVHALASILNSLDVGQVARVHSSSEQTPIDLLVKRHGETTYVFAVGMRNGSAQGTFTVRGLPQTAHAKVIGESRTLLVKSGRFTDTFAPYEVHLYRIAYENKSRPSGERQSFFLPYSHRHRHWRGGFRERDAAGRFAALRVCHYHCVVAVEDPAGDAPMRVGLS